jgi:hypothetical protein
MMSDSEMGFSAGSGLDWGKFPGCHPHAQAADGGDEMVWIVDVHREVGNGYGRFAALEAVGAFLPDVAPRSFCLRQPATPSFSSASSLPLMWIAMVKNVTDDFELVRNTGGGGKVLRLKICGFPTSAIDLAAGSAYTRRLMPFSSMIGRTPALPAGPGFSPALLAGDEPAPARSAAGQPELLRRFSKP